MTRALTEVELAGLEMAAAVGFFRAAPEVPDVLRRAGDEAPELTFVAFAAHQRRLSTLPPRLPEPLERVEAPDDPRPVVPPAVRVALRRLATAAQRRRATELLAPVGWALRDRGWRIHPFDADLLPHLEAAAGTYERWLGRSSGVEVGGDAWLDAVDEAGWAALTPAPRAAWLRRRRHADPAAARALLVAAWPAEKADVRARLLGAMDVRLGPDDVEFLGALDKDRSAPVREIAKRLRARAGAGMSDVEFVTAVQAAFEVRSGPPRRVHLRDTANPGRLVLALAERPVDVMCGVLGATVDELLVGTGAIATMFPGFALGCLHRPDLVAHARFARAAIAAGWSPFAGAWGARFAEVPRDRRREALLPLLDEDGLEPHLVAAIASPASLLELLGGPLSASASRRVRQSGAWRALLAKVAAAEDATPEAALRLAAPLVPGRDARDAVAQLDAVGAPGAALVRALWCVLADIEG